MITKKLGKITFGWDPNAMKGKGHWFVVGPDETFTRPATETETSKLGFPQQKDKPKKGAADRKYFGFKTYYDVDAQGRPTRRIQRTDSKFETADIIKSKRLMQLATEKLLSGQSLGSSLKGAVSDKIGANVTSIQKMYNPMNMLSKIPGVGQLAAALYGKKFNKDVNDITYFTGVRPPDRDDNRNGRISSKGVKSEVERLIESKLKKEDVGENLLEEQQLEKNKIEEKRHEELIDAIKNTYLWGYKGKGKMGGGSGEGGDGSFIEGAAGGAAGAAAAGWLKKNWKKIKTGAKSTGKFLLKRAGPIGLALTAIEALQWAGKNIVQPAAGIDDRTEARKAEEAGASPEKVKKIKETESFQRKIKRGETPKQWEGSEVGDVKVGPDGKQYELRKDGLLGPKRWQEKKETNRVDNVNGKTPTPWSEEGDKKSDMIVAEVYSNKEGLLKYEAKTLEGLEKQLMADVKKKKITFQEANDAFQVAKIEYDEMIQKENEKKVKSSGSYKDEGKTNKKDVLKGKEENQVSEKLKKEAMMFATDKWLTKDQQDIAKQLAQTGKISDSDMEYLNKSLNFASTQLSGAKNHSNDKKLIEEKTKHYDALNGLLYFADRVRAGDYSNKKEKSSGGFLGKLFGIDGSEKTITAKTEPKEEKSSGGFLGKLFGMDGSKKQKTQGQKAKSSEEKHKSRSVNISNGYATVMVDGKEITDPEEKIKHIREMGQKAVEAGPRSDSTLSHEIYEKRIEEYNRAIEFEKKQLKKQKTSSGGDQLSELEKTEKDMFGNVESLSGSGQQHEDIRMAGTHPQKIDYFEKDGKTYERIRTSRTLIGGEDYIEGNRLSDKQMRAMKMALMMPNNRKIYSETALKQYELQKAEAQSVPSEISQRANKSTIENQQLKSDEKSKQTGPMVVNNTNNVVNNSTGPGSSKPAGTRNDLPILDRVLNYI